MQHQSGRSGSQVLYIPEYGPIEALLGYAFFYFLVAVGTPVVRAAVRTSPLEVSADLVGFAAAAGLWFILGLTILGQVTEQERSNPHRFEDQRAAADYLEAIAPSVARMQGWGLALGIGLVVVVLGFDPFLASYRSLLEGVVWFVGTTANTRGVFRSLPWFIVYTIGFSLVTRYTDRLILGWGRRRRLERYEQ